MSLDNEKAVAQLLAKAEIRDLVFRYSEAITNRDIDLLVELYVEDASFGSIGSGEDALRSMADNTMSDLEFAVILVSNHLITFENGREATGEVWARCFAQNNREGYYEQLIRYSDRYQLVGSTEKNPGVWKFKHRRHNLWFGQSKDSPLTLPEALWPENNIGIGREPLEDETIKELRKRSG